MTDTERRVTEAEDIDARLPAGYARELCLGACEGVMPTKKKPKVVVLAGPNGAGKTTTAPKLLRGLLGVTEFVNADAIAQGLSGFAPERAAISAGRVMLSRVKELAQGKKDFAFETTLASRSFLPWLKKLVARGYELHLVFLWLPSADAAVARVAERVRLGGHDVPEATVRRRYLAGVRNFFALYQPLATSWQVIDNSRNGRPKVVAVGTRRKTTIVRDRTAWTRIQEGKASEA